MTDNDAPPQPDPALRRLDRFDGRWSMGGPPGRLRGDEHPWGDGVSLAAGRLLLEQHVQLDFMGLEMDSLELIGLRPEAETFPSTVFSNLSPTRLPYRRGTVGDVVTITVSYGPLDATFTGSWREDGTFSGGWRPNPAADESVNVPYDIGGRRLG